MDKKHTKKIIAVFIGAVSVCLLTMLDQYAKWLATINLKGKTEPITAIPHVLQLTYLQNRGAAWGMLQNRQWLFIVVGVALFAILAFFYFNLPDTKKYLPLRALIILLISGDVGNMIDRIVNGYVVDFFEFIFISFPVFNIADIYVTVSVAVLFVLILFVYQEDDWLIFKKEKQ